MRLVFAFLVMAALLVAAEPAFAQVPSGPADISLTISNRSGVELALSLSEWAGLPLPPTLVPSASTSAPKGPASTVPGKPAQPLRLQVKAGQSSTLALKPGQYHLRAESLPSGQPAQMTMGFVSVTNSEVWIFNLDRDGRSMGEVHGKWVMEVQSRPGFRLSNFAESPPLALPPRVLRQDYSPPPSLALPPRAARLPETNSSR